MLQVIAGLTSSVGPRHVSILMVAADRGSLEAVTAVMSVVSVAHVGTNPSVSFLAGVSVHTVSFALPFFR